ncbi:alpha/beta hydrolase [Mycobacterium sp. PS03-16]|uniref:alpha/beta hydrolase n=1 Tax=Mycobacterium sp. PS03-16 TaxID=2559611 RepID=UPI001073FD92|nr:alpha/beta hydrolase [Mycobacterium sp. PS03-16]TFV61376.1 alpha/beta hydrolase [Mycobacterium sp. PS03-16]
MRARVRLAVIVVLVVSGVLGLLWTQQRRLVYFPSRGPVPSVAAVAPGAQDVVVRTADGLELGAWFFPATPGPAVLICNGNGGDRSMRAALAVALRARGLSVLLFDYRGYGGNPGRPTEDGLAADARAARDWLAAQPQVDPSRIAYLGESLGAAVAVGLATEQPPAALILRSPFTSLADAGAVHYPWLPVRRLLIDRYPSLERIGALRSPLLVIAGDRDDIVPAELSRRLYDAAPQPKTWVTVPGAGHNDPALLDGPVLLTAIDRFLTTTAVLGR